MTLTSPSVIGATVCLVVLLAARAAPTLERRVTGDEMQTDRSAPRSRMHRATSTLGRVRQWSRWRRRGATVFPGAVAAYGDDLARSIRRGITLRQSVLDVNAADGPLDAAVERLRFRLERGEALSHACTRWVASIERAGPGSRHLVALGSVIAVAASVGGRAGEPLDRLAATMRQFAADDLERAAQSAQARVSARVLTVLPLGVLAVLGLSDGDVRAVVASRAGAALVGLGLTLNVIGALWMRSIVQRGAVT